MLLAQHTLLCALQTTAAAQHTDKGQAMPDLPSEHTKPLRIRHSLYPQKSSYILVFTLEDLLQHGGAST